MSRYKSPAGKHRHKCPACHAIWEHRDDPRNIRTDAEHRIAHTCPGCEARYCLEHFDGRVTPDRRSPGVREPRRGRQPGEPMSQHDPNRLTDLKNTFVTPPEPPRPPVPPPTPPIARIDSPVERYGQLVAVAEAACQGYSAGLFGELPPKCPYAPQGVPPHLAHLVDPRAVAWFHGWNAAKATVATKPEPTEGSVS